MAMGNPPRGNDEGQSMNAVLKSILEHGPDSDLQEHCHTTITVIQWWGTVVVFIMVKPILVLSLCFSGDQTSSAVAFGVRMIHLQQIIMT